MRVAIVGSRISESTEAWNHRDKLSDLLRWLAPHVTLVVTGGALGVDTWAEELATRFRIPCRIIRPNPIHGAKGPLMRNKTIIENADFVIAFHFFKSRGTADAISKARYQRKPGVIYDGETWEPI